jgi:hypothetical protein
VAIRLVSPGRGSRRDLVLLYNVPGTLDAMLVDAAQGACILNDTRTPTTRYARSGPAGILPLAETLEAAEERAGPFELGRVVVGGIGPGGHAARTMLLDATRGGRVPDAIVVADGTHASRPPQDWEIDAWRAFAFEARAGRRIGLFSHTCIEAPTLLSTRDTIRLITGWPLDTAGPVEDPVVKQQGRLRVESYSGTQPADHDVQAQRVFPALLRKAMTLLWDMPDSDVNFDETLPISTPLGARALGKSNMELDAGAGEEPLGSGGGPRVAEYLRGCVRGGHRLGIEQGDWNAAACSWAAASVAHEGERLPHEWRADAREIWEDAEAAGFAIPVTRVRSRAWRARTGDLALLRGPTGAWRVGRVDLPPDVEGRYTTVEAGCAGRWAREERHLSDEDLVGFVEYPR